MRRCCTRVRKVVVFSSRRFCSVMVGFLGMVVVMIRVLLESDKLLLVMIGEGDGYRFGEM